MLINWMQLSMVTHRQYEIFPSVLWCCWLGLL